jgi:uncharacterized SAM-binding protein YcdF (DUF218 family)
MTGKFILRIFFIFNLLILSGCGSYFRNRYYSDPEESYSNAVQTGPYDAIIVPGYPHSKDKWSDIVKIRVYWADYLYKKGLTRNIIFSGSAVYTPYVESEVMALYAEALGVPAEHIFTETRAEHSCENLYYSLEIAKEKGFSRVAVATDPAQTGFLKAFKRRYKMEVDFIPVVFNTLSAIEKPEPDIDEEKAFVVNFVSLPERESPFKRLRGTRGAKVNKLIKEKRKSARKKNQD